MLVHRKAKGKDYIKLLQEKQHPLVVLFWVKKLVSPKMFQNNVKVDDPYFEIG